MTPTLIGWPAACGSVGWLADTGCAWSCRVLARALKTTSVPAAAAAAAATAAAAPPQAAGTVARAGAAKRPGWCCACRAAGAVEAAAGAKPACIGGAQEQPVRVDDHGVPCAGRWMAAGTTARADRGVELPVSKEELVRCPAAVLAVSALLDKGGSLSVCRSSNPSVFSEACKLLEACVSSEVRETVEASGLSGGGCAGESKASGMLPTRGLSDGQRLFKRGLSGNCSLPCSWSLSQSCG